MLLVLSCSADFESTFPRWENKVTEPTWTRVLLSNMLIILRTFPPVCEGFLYLLSGVPGQGIAFAFLFFLFFFTFSLRLYCFILKGAFFFLRFISVVSWSSPSGDRQTYAEDKLQQQKDANTFNWSTNCCATIDDRPASSDKKRIHLTKPLVRMYRCKGRCAGEGGSHIKD